MKDDLYRLVYYSRNRMHGSASELQRQIGAILSASRSNNAKAGVGGALIFNAGIFAQVLEGSLSDVEITFERIQRDPRHDEVQVLTFERAPARRFPSWSMGYVGRSEESRSVFGDIARTTSFDASRMEGERVLEIMVRIAVEEEDRQPSPEVAL